MLTIRVNIKQVICDCLGKGSNGLEVDSLADVDHAFKHGSAYRKPPSAATVTVMISFLNGPELLIVLLVVLVIFGGSQLPKLAKNLGQAQKEFKKAIDDEKSSPDSSTDKQ